MIGIFHKNPKLWSIIKYNFQKISWINSEKSSKILILGSKIPNLPHFRHNKKFPQTLCYLLKPNIWKKLHTNPEKTMLHTNIQTNRQAEDSQHIKTKHTEKDYILTNIIAGFKYIISFLFCHVNTYFLTL